MSQPTSDGVGKSLLVLNGPGLEKLGAISPEIYGTETIAGLRRLCEMTGAQLGYKIDFRQSNNTGDLLEWIVGARETHAGIIVNPAISTRTEPLAQDAYVAIMQALRHVKLPTIEVHLSNLFKQGDEPRLAYDSTVSLGLIAGFGVEGYVLALKGLAAHLTARQWKVK